MADDFALLQKEAEALEQELSGLSREKLIERIKNQAGELRACERYSDIVLSVLTEEQVDEIEKRMAVVIVDFLVDAKKESST